MTAFNTFFLQFRNDAAKSKKDVAELEKQIDSLRAKGKKRTEEEDKQLQQAVRRQREMQQQARETEKNYERLSDSVATAAAAYVSLAAIKSGVVNAAEFNRTLAVQAKNLGLVTQDLRAYGAAIRAAGGSEESFFGFVQQKRMEAASMGRTFNIRRYMDDVRSYISGMTDSGKLAVLSELGITDPGMIAALQATQEEYEKMIALGYENAAVTGKQEEAAIKFGAAQDRLTVSMRSFWSAIGEQTLPALTSLTNGFSGFVSELSKDEEAVKTSLKAMTVAGLGLASVAPVISKTWLGALAGVGAKLLAFLELGKEIGKLINDATTGGSTSIFKQIPEWFLNSEKRKKTSSWLDRNRLNPFSSSEEYDAEERAMARRSASRPAKRLADGDKGWATMQYLQEKGFTRDEAAAIAANIKHESSFNPSARGDGGLAHGAFQWHNTKDSGYRRSRILKATGIDVSNAPLEKQIDAAIWEMQHGDTGFSMDKFKSMRTATEKARYISDVYLRPYDPMGLKAAARGRTAMEMADANPLNASAGTISNSSQTAVKIDKIEVNTQATNAELIANDIGIEIESALQNMLGNAAGNFDDGSNG